MPYCFAYKRLRLVMPTAYTPIGGWTVCCLEAPSYLVRFGVFLFSPLCEGISCFFCLFWPFLISRVYGIGPTIRFDMLPLYLLVYGSFWILLFNKSHHL